MKAREAYENIIENIHDCAPNYDTTKIDVEYFEDTPSIYSDLIYDDNEYAKVTVDGEKEYILDPYITLDEIEDIIAEILTEAEYEELDEEDAPEETEDDVEVIEENVDTEAMEEEAANIHDNYPALLVALDSERDAELTYRTLIDIESTSDHPNQEVIDLLNKILNDELEHIALLSALQANKNSEYVGEDAKQDFDDIVNDTVAKE